jgi:hypothetical protein
MSPTSANAIRLSITDLAAKVRSVLVGRRDTHRGTGSGQGAYRLRLAVVAVRLTCRRWSAVVACRCSRDR